jgi:site-specific DNA recombinase
MRKKMQEGDTPARKTWLRSMIDLIEVDDSALLLLAGKLFWNSALSSGRQVARSFALYLRRWCSLRESNPPYQIENLVS